MRELPRAPASKFSQRRLPTIHPPSAMLFLWVSHKTAVTETSRLTALRCNYNPLPSKLPIILRNAAPLRLLPRLCSRARHQVRVAQMTTELFPTGAAVQLLITAVGLCSR